MPLLVWRVCDAGVEGDVSKDIGIWASSSSYYINVEREIDQCQYITRNNSGIPHGAGKSLYLLKKIYPHALAVHIKFCSDECGENTRGETCDWNAHHLSPTLFTAL